ncbi:MAG: thioredoxin domain-containing protein [Burkholderiales bacterium]|nr:thioredoxin domain-containing protein [Burkholderiales bacterium]
MSQKNIFFLIMGLLILGTVATILLNKGSSTVSTKYDAFAQCLASKDMTMYGAVWCSHCKAEKDKFEGAFKYVPYVECTENPDLCIAKGIEGYPTWIDGEGKKYVGEQGLEKLSEISGCVLPTN